MLWIIIYSGFVLVVTQKQRERGQRRRESKQHVVSICLVFI